MDPIHLELTIPNRELFVGFGLLVFAITAFLSVSNHREKLKRIRNPLQWMADHYVYVLLPLGALAIGLAVIYWIWDIRGEIGRIIALLRGEDNPESIRNLAYAIGALLAAVALSATIPFQLIKVWVNERLAKTTEQGHMTDRITKAVEQLGAEKTVKEDGIEKTVPNLEVRLGAIYLLKRIAQDSLRDHIPVMEILCAYVRNNARPIPDRDWDHNISSENLLNETENKVLIRSDIQASLSAIGRRDPKRVQYERNTAQYSLDLTHTNLDWAKFDKLDFRFADFTNSSLVGTSWFLSKLDRALFVYSTLLGANMWMADIPGVNFLAANMAESNMIGVNANRQAARFYSSILVGCNFASAQLQNADFQHCDFSNVDFKDSNLSGSKLNHAVFRATTALSGCIFNLAYVRLAEFQSCTSLSNGQLDLAFGDDTTELPDYLEKPEWSTRVFKQGSDAREKWQAAKAAAKL